MKFPAFPVSPAFLSGLFDTTLFRYRKRGNIELRCSHCLPLRMIQNWYPGKLHVSGGKYTLTISGPPALALVSFVGPWSRCGHDFDRDGVAASLEHVDIGLGFVEVAHHADAYLMGVSLACGGRADRDAECVVHLDDPVLNRHLVTWPDAAPKKVCLTMARDVPVITMSRDTVDVLNKIVALTCPQVPQSLVVNRARHPGWRLISLRSRNVTKAIRSISRRLKTRPRRAALSEEHKEVIDMHVGLLGVKYVCNLLNVPRAQVLARVTEMGLHPPRDPIGREIHRCVTRNVSREDIRFFITYVFGVRLTPKCISTRLSRYTPSADTSGQN
jgi:hypothetical protein